MSFNRAYFLQEMILRKADEREVDMLVVGHRGLNVIERAVLGSVSQYLVNNAKCSVLVV